MNLHQRLFLYFTCTVLIFSTGLSNQIVSAAETVTSSDGTQSSGTLKYSNGKWTVNGKPIPRLLQASFPGGGKISSVPDGVYLRNGTLVRGRLTNYGGGSAAIFATVLGDKKKNISGNEIAGAYFASGDRGKAFTALMQYAQLLRGSLQLQSPGLGENNSLTLHPGKQNRYVTVNGTSIDGQLKFFSDQVCMFNSDLGLDKVNTKRLLMLELKTASDKKGSYSKQEIIWARLTGGDLLCGVPESLDGKSFSIQIPNCGKITVPRKQIASLFSAGGSKAKIIFLSSLKPQSTSVQPLFDAEFPPRNDASVVGEVMMLGGSPCERGVGMRSKSTVTYKVPAGSKRFVALVGLDDNSGNHGQADASVLAGKKALWQAKDIKGGSGPQLVNIPLAGAKQITLKVDYGADQNDSGDHLNWGWAVFIQ